VGMKPTFGRVSNRGAYPLAWTLDHVGPMTKTVYDNALLLNVLSGYDREEPYSIYTKEQDFTAQLKNPPENIVIGVPTNDFFAGGDADVKESYAKAIDTFKRLGCQVKEIEIPAPENIIDAFRTVITNEAYTLHE